MSADALVEDVEFLLADGATAVHAAMRVGVTPQRLRARLTQAGRPDLWQRLTDDRGGILIPQSEAQRICRA